MADADEIGHLALSRVHIYSIIIIDFYVVTGQTEKTTIKYNERLYRL